MKENAAKKALKRENWYRFGSISIYKHFILKSFKKTLKKVKKYFKKVLTNENIYDILHERSTEGRKKQRSLKIEQQQIRTN